MGVRLLLFSWILLPGALFAYVVQEPKAPAPAQKNYQEIITDLNRTTFVVISYYDGSTAMVTGPKWIEQLKQLLSATKGKRAEYCFCVNYPEITLLTKDEELASLEVAHGKKLRFGGASYSGDFEVDENIAEAVAKLAMSEKIHAMPRPKKLPKKPLPPPRLEINP